MLAHGIILARAIKKFLRTINLYQCSGRSCTLYLFIDTFGLRKSGPKSKLRYLNVEAEIQIFNFVLGARVQIGSAQPRMKQDHSG